MTDPYDLAAELIANERDRGLGDAVLGSMRVEAQESDALLAASENLLGKAARALADGDHERAQRFVARALALPFNEHEEAVPALWTSHTTLFTLVTDVAEGSDEDDLTWLDAVSAVMDAGTDGMGAALAQVLAEMLVSYEFPPHDARRIRELTARFPGTTPPANFHGHDLDDAGRTAWVRDRVAALVAYEAALEAAGFVAEEADPEDLAPDW